jgi:hypothetical protein
VHIGRRVQGGQGFGRKPGGRAHAKVLAEPHAVVQPQGRHIGAQPVAAERAGGGDIVRITVEVGDHVRLVARERLDDVECARPELARPELARLVACVRQHDERALVPEPGLGCPFVNRRREHVQITAVRDVGGLDAAAGQDPDPEPARGHRHVGGPQDSHRAGRQATGRVCRADRVVEHPARAQPVQLLLHRRFGKEAQLTGSAKGDQEVGPEPVEVAGEHIPPGQIEAHRVDRDALPARRAPAALPAEDLDPVPAGG